MEFFVKCLSALVILGLVEAIILTLFVFGFVSLMWGMFHRVTRHPWFRRQ